MANYKSSTMIQTCPFLSLIIIIIIINILLAVEASPPQATIQCSAANSTNCTFTNTYGAFPDRSTCRAAAAFFPTSEAELAAAVASAVQLGLKVKAATPHGHSIPSLACPGGAGLGVLISTERLSAVVGFDMVAQTVTVEGGASLRAVMEAAAEVGLALPHGPYWWGLSVGGMVGTGSHGSSLWGLGSSVHDYIVALTIVSPGGPEDGFVKVRRLVAGRDDRELNAVRVSLGVLGVISQVTLKLQPMFKRSISYVTKNDSDLGDQVSSFGRKHEFADITWLPSQRKAVYRVDDRVPVTTPGDGLNDAIAFRSTSSFALAITRVTEEIQEARGNDLGKCISAIVLTSTLARAAYGLTNNGKNFTGYPVIGYQNRLQASGTCLDSPKDMRATVCPWDPRVIGLFFHQTTFSVALPAAKDFIEDVQALVGLEPRALCGAELYNGILMRYVTASTAYLGKQGDGIDFDITYYRSRDPLEPRLHEDIFEEIEQIAFFKYGALPHWGKNRNVAFIGAITKYEAQSEFLRVREEFDPLGIFSSDWSDQILGLKTGLEILKEGCALEGLCICREDLHCSPSKGYFCRPGRIYKDARVCRLLNDKQLIRSD